MSKPIYFGTKIEDSTMAMFSTSIKGFHNGSIITPGAKNLILVRHYQKMSIQNVKMKTYWLLEEIPVFQSKQKFIITFIFVCYHSIFLNF